MYGVECEVFYSTVMASTIWVAKNSSRTPVRWYLTLIITLKVFTRYTSDLCSCSLIRSYFVHSVQTEWILDLA